MIGRKLSERSLGEAPDNLTGTDQKQNESRAPNNSSLELVPGREPIGRMKQSDQTQCKK